MEHARILMVDDEQSIIDMMKLVLTKEGFQQVDTCSTGEMALHKLKHNAYDLILLDIMLPDMTGYEICQAIRKTTEAPIFFLSAKTSDLDKLTGFAHGGDDYITKPFNPLEVVARIKVQLNRYLKTTPSKEEDVLKFGRFKLNLQSAELTVLGENVLLSGQLYHLLVFFCKNPNRIFTKEQLYYHVWGDHILVDENTVMVHIRKLREKIEENPSKPEYIKTVRGIGYKLVPAAGNQK
ncbi:MAG: response regulator transcription factor [Bacillota bacterium]|jgi:DNA-binding response OmpR family regulator|uniref:response regulator transcription factor n=1 Tax=Bacillus sp. RO2 TaxID=2723913 RepID=UPI00145C547C|nr:response regulator transcription factor [Bacillus sp. RO2]MEA3321365.1 response regulator transcription factor [Bacillota bacterium]NMH72070.1 response regulator transcription factor [Bacillus sp. RO2]